MTKTRMISLSTPIATLNISTLAKNALTADGSRFVGDLVTYTLPQLRSIPNLGVISIMGIANALSEFGLRIGMSLSDFPSAEVREYRKNYDPEARKAANQRWQVSQTAEALRQGFEKLIQREPARGVRLLGK